LLGEGLGSGTVADGPGVVSAPGPEGKAEGTVEDRLLKSEVKAASTSPGAVLLVEGFEVG